MENRNVFGFIIQYDMDEIKCSLKKAKKTAFRYFGLLVLAGLLATCFAVKYEHMYILPIWTGISVPVVCRVNLLEEAKSIRDRKRLAGMMQAGDKILELQRHGALICFVMEHRSYGEDKTTFALSMEEMTFHCKKMYTTDSTSIVFNLNHLILTIPYFEEINQQKNKSGKKDPKSGGFKMAEIYLKDSIGVWNEKTI